MDKLIHIECDKPFVEVNIDSLIEALENVDERGYILFTDNNYLTLTLRGDNETILI